ncbi:MAG: Ig-like domain-containing protein [Clostridia bacterium]|nr:Ig-like domain-containing protein [Clostridia bacterium]
MKKRWLLWIVSALLLFAAGCAGGASDAYTVSLSATSLQMDLYGEEAKLTATTKQNFVATSGAVEWSSSDPEIVRVENGVLNPLQIGEAVITAKWQGAEAQCTVIVSSNSVPTLQIEQSQMDFIFGESAAQTVDAWVVYKNETYKKDAEITYTLPESGASIVSVDQNGKVTPIGVGETELTVSATFRNYNGVGMTKRIPVSVFYDFNVEIGFAEGAAETLYVKAGNYDGTAYENKTSFTKTVYQMSENGMQELSASEVVWKTSDESVATVSENGEVTALQAGDVSVWCEYTYQGVAHRSNAVAFSVQPYFKAQTVEGKLALLDKSNASNYLSVAEVFGADYEGSLVGIYVKGKNVLTANGVDVSDFNEKYYEIDYVNDQGYAYTFNGAIATHVAQAEGTAFGILKFKTIGNEQYYNLILPSLDDVRALLEKGYKSLQVNYAYAPASENERVVLAAKYESELKKELSATTDDYVQIDLNLFTDRYEELDELSWTESVFTVSGGNGAFDIQAFVLCKNGSAAYADFKLDRRTSVGNFDVEYYAEKEGVVAQVKSSGTVKSETRTIVKAGGVIASKNTVRYWLNDGYDLYEVRYYLAYDASKMTKPITAYTGEYEGSKAAKIGEDTTLVANQWATATFRLDRFYAMSLGWNSLFMFNAYAADDGSEMDYEFYIEYIRAKKSGEASYDIRMYAGYPVEMWTPESSPRGVSEYDKVIDGKTAKFYFSFNAEIYHWGCSMGINTGLNVTVEQLKAMKAAGATYLDFEIYAKTSVGAALDFRLDPEKKGAYNELHRYSLPSGQWTTVSIALDLLIDYYDVMNGCGGGKAFGKVMPFRLTDHNVESIVYEFGVGTITPR